MQAGRRGQGMCFSSERTSRGIEFFIEWDSCLRRDVPAAGGAFSLREDESRLVFVKKAEKKLLTKYVGIGIINSFFAAVLESADRHV